MNGESRPRTGDGRHDRGEAIYGQSSPVAARMAAIAAATGERMEHRHEPSMWLRGRIIDLDTRLSTGTLRVCPRLRPYDIGTVALWAPDRVLCASRTCRDCQSVWRLTGDADHTCDRCHAVVPIIHPDMAGMDANVLILFGLCPACHRREVGP